MIKSKAPIGKRSPLDAPGSGTNLAKLGRKYVEPFCFARRVQPNRASRKFRPLRRVCRTPSRCVPFTTQADKLSINRTTSNRGYGAGLFAPRTRTPTTTSHATFQPFNRLPPSKSACVPALPNSAAARGRRPACITLAPWRPCAQSLGRPESVRRCRCVGGSMAIPRSAASSSS